MSEQISIGLKDETAAGAASIEKNLAGIEQAGEATEASLNDVIASIEKLTDELQKETTVVHEHTSSWTHFGATAVPAMATMVGTLAKYSVEIVKLTSRLDTLQFALSKAKDSQQAYNLVKQQAFGVTAKAAGALTGYAEAVSGVVAVIATAKAAHIAYNTLLENTGKSADGLTNNLTRTREANSALWDDIKATAGAGADAVKDWGIETVANAARSIDELTGVSTAWKEVDRAMTESTNNYVNNTRVIGEAIRGVSRDAVKASKEIAKAQADAVDDFDRVRMSNEEIEQAAKNRAEAERLASLDTVEAINSELQAMQQRRGEAAASNKFSEDDQKRYVAAVGSLEQKRTDITKREAGERASIIKKEADDRADSDKREAQRYEDARNKENEKILDEYRDQARAEIDARKAREKEVEQFIQREYQKIIDEERKKFDAMQQAAQDRLDLLKQERDQRIAMLQNAIGEDGKNLLQGAREGIDPAKLRDEVVRRAREQARGQLKPVGDDVNTFEAQRKAAAKQAGINAFRDFNAGKTDPGQIASAQNSLVQGQIQAAQGRGDLDQQTAQALMTAAQNQQSIIQTQQQQAQVLQQVQAALGQNGTASRNTYASGRRQAYGK